MKARLVDVAQEAGVSAKTVSNYINGYPFMSEATTAKVKAAIAKLSYVPNRSAQTLRTGKIGIIGLVVPKLSTPYFAELASRVSDAAEDRGYTVLIDQTGGEIDRERRAIAGVGPQALDGVIVSPLRLTATEATAATQAIPMVLLGEGAHPAGVPYVGVDNVAAARTATEHLLARGARRVAAIGTVSPIPRGTWGFRMKGYRAALKAAGIPSRRQWEPRINEFSREQGVRAMERLLALAEPPDAVFCFSDLLAIGAMSVLHRRGLRIPEDVAVVGWDDIEEAAYAWPPLTTVRADPDLVAHTAVDYLLGQINNETLEQPVRYVDYTLVERESTAGA